MISPRPTTAPSVQVVIHIQPHPVNTGIAGEAENASWTAFQETYRAISEAQVITGHLFSLSTPHPDTIQREHLVLRSLDDRLVGIHLVGDDKANYHKHRCHLAKVIAKLQDLLDSYLVSYVDTVTGGGPGVCPPKTKLPDENIYMLV